MIDGKGAAGRDGAPARADWQRFLDGCRFGGLVVVFRWVLEMWVMEMWVMEMIRGVEPL